MRYPIAIEIGTGETAYGIVVPDLPGCFSAGDTLDEAVVGAGEAVTGWIEAMLDAGGVVPAASAMAAIQGEPAYAGWLFDVVVVEPTDYSGIG